MHVISARDLPTVVTLIGRLPDRYVKNENLYDGVYNKLSPTELEQTRARGIKV